MQGSSGAFPMAVFLFTWELGSGLGHMMQILPLARESGRRGNDVYVAVRDVSGAIGVFGDTPARLLQAPVKMSPRISSFNPPRTWPHILHNVGYATVSELAGLTCAWRTLLQSLRPDVVIFDHSPTAMLAARGMPPAKVVIGSGFGVPLDEHPLPNLRGWEPADPAALAADEGAVLGRMNQVLDHLHAPHLDRINQMYSEVDDTFLLTFRELDHYQNRPPEAHYRGAWTERGGQPPRWPSGSGPRIYAYLKPFPALPQVLAFLKQRACPTLIFMQRTDDALRRQFSSSSLQFVEERLDLSITASQCDLAIVHGTHGTVFSLLMAGKPTLQLPIYLEQGLLAALACRTGAALQPPIGNPIQICRDLELMLTSTKYATSACQFANTHQGFDAEEQNHQMVARLEQLAH
jgi:UDP:flavonoid glycosyltransferase YjiC (YdhE family)